MSAFLRTLGLLALVLLGAFAGLAGVVVSRQGVDAFGVRLPYGLVLAVVATALLFREGGIALGRPGALAAIVGWAILVVAALWPKPEGDIVVGGDLLGAGFVLLGMFAAAWNLVRTPRRPDGREPDGPRVSGR